MIINLWFDENYTLTLKVSLTELILMTLLDPETKSGTLAVTTHAPHPAWLQLILVPFKFATSLIYLAKLKLGEILDESTEIMLRVVSQKNISEGKNYSQFWSTPLILNVTDPWTKFSLESSLVLFAGSPWQHFKPRFDATCCA